MAGAEPNEVSAKKANAKKASASRIDLKAFTAFLPGSFCAKRWYAWGYFVPRGMRVLAAQTTSL
jgi:hypothetical protein